jgi:hypothetical protein
VSALLEAVEVEEVAFQGGCQAAELRGILGAALAHPQRKLAAMHARIHKHLGATAPGLAKQVGQHLAAAFLVVMVVLSLSASRTHASAWEAGCVMHQWLGMQSCMTPASCIRAWEAGRVRHVWLAVRSCMRRDMLIAYDVARRGVRGNAQVWERLQAELLRRYSVLQEQMALCYPSMQLAPSPRELEALCKAVGAS